jgi:hypothetical protein
LKLFMELIRQIFFLLNAFEIILRSFGLFTKVNLKN